MSLIEIARAMFPAESPLGQMLRRAKRRMVGPPASQLSAVLKAFAAGQPEPRFLQIGANDGVTQDPLHDFIVTYRWRGILVEPLKHLFERLKRTYARCPGLIFENVAISSREGMHDFYDVADPAEPEHGLPPWYAGLGSLSRGVVLSHAGQYPAIRRNLRVQQVPCITFESLCARHRVDALDVIVIDAEGHDFEIITLIDFTRFRPLILIYEHHHLCPADRAACRARLSAEGYEFIEEVLNTICVNVRGLEPQHWRLRRKWEELRPV